MTSRRLLCPPVPGVRFLRTYLSFNRPCVFRTHRQVSTLCRFPRGRDRVPRQEAFAQKDGCRLAARDPDPGRRTRARLPRRLPRFPEPAARSGPPAPPAASWASPPRAPHAVLGAPRAPPHTRQSARPPAAPPRSGARRVPGAPACPLPAVHAPPARPQDLPGSRAPAHPARALATGVPGCTGTSHRPCDAPAPHGGGPGGSQPVRGFRADSQLLRAGAAQVPRGRARPHGLQVSRGAGVRPGPPRGRTSSPARVPLGA